MSLKDEIEALKGRIYQVEGIVEALKEQLSQLEVRYQQEIEQQQTVKSSLKANTPRDAEKKKVRIDESANTTSIIKDNASGGAVDVEKSTPPSTTTPTPPTNTTPPATETPESIFEIREFVDDQNKEQQYELLDVTKQLEYMEQMYKNSLDSSSASTQQYSEEEELIRELAMIADKKAESIKNKQLQDNLKSSGVSSDKPVVEDVDDLIDILDKLDVRQKKRDKPKPAAASGWKAGFLSSPNVPTTPAAPTTIAAPRRSTQSLPAPPPTVLPTQPAPVVITKEDGAFPRDGNVAVSPSKTAPSTPVSAQSTEKAPTPKPVKKAFNGVVLEKF
eukprot:gene12612-13804_t